MLLGRLAGWLMVVFGIVLLLRYYSEQAATGRFVPQAVADMWHGADAAMLSIVERTFVERFSAAMLSGWTAALLLLFGILLVWGCRRGRFAR